MDIGDLQPLVDGRSVGNGNGSVLQNGGSSYGNDKNAVNFDFGDLHNLPDTEDTPFIRSNSTLLEPPWSPRASNQVGQIWIVNYLISQFSLCIYSNHVRNLHVRAIYIVSEATGNIDHIGIE